MILQGLVHIRQDGLLLAIQDAAVEALQHGQVRAVVVGQGGLAVAEAGHESLERVVALPASVEDQVLHDLPVVGIDLGDRMTFEALKMAMSRPCFTPW